jgi:hypothetical protein
MPTFLERYQNGEHEQVWADLTALGSGVRDNLYLADAQAVANETMRRARHNVETLIVPLQGMGYEFRTKEKEAGQRAKRRDQAMGALKALTEVIGKKNPTGGLKNLVDRSEAMMNNPMKRGDDEQSHDASDAGPDESEGENEGANDGPAEASRYLRPTV